MSKYAHVVKTAGHLINDGYLEKVVKNHRHYYGVAVVDGDKILLVHQQSQPDVDTLKKVQEKFKDNSAVFAFGDVAHIMAEDMQPISILKDADGNHVCVVCLDGDFDRHKKANESHIPEYLVAKNFLEKLVRKHAASGIDSLIGELNDELTKQTICNLWGERGCITFMFSDGQVCTIRSSEDKGKYSWGFASSDYGYMENVGGDTKETKPPSTLDKLKDLVTGKKEATEPVPQNGAVVSSAVTTEPTATTVVEELPPGTVLEKPDFQFYDTRKKQKAYYESRLGYEIQAYKSAPPLLRIPDPKNPGLFTYKLADTKSLGILAHTIVYYPAKDSATKSNGQTTQTTAPTTQSQVPTTQSVTTQTTQPDNTPPWLASKKGKSEPSKSEIKEVGGGQSKTIAESALPAGGNTQAQQTVPASVKTDRVPVLPPDQIQKVQEIMKKTEFVGLFGESMKKIIDPKDLKKHIETEIPDFAKRFGLGNDMSVFEGWTYEQYFQWATAMLQIGKPDIIAKFCFDLMNHALKQKELNLTNPNIRKAGAL